MNRYLVWGTLLFLCLASLLMSSRDLVRAAVDPPSEEEALSEAYRQLQEAIKEFLDQNYQAARKNVDRAKQFLQQEGREFTRKTETYFQELQKQLEQLEREIEKGKEGTARQLQETWRTLKELLTHPPFQVGQAETFPGLDAYPAFHIWVQLVEKLKPAVVHISTTRPPSEDFPSTPYGEDDPLSEFFYHSFRVPEQGYLPEYSLGSGFLISAEGYILTMQSVIESGQQLLVKLADAQQYVPEIVAQDERTGIVLLKITPPPNVTLSFLSLGDSDRVHLAEPVLAMGNPFGLAPLVTIGTVSATGKVVGAGAFDDFIQFTAPLHPGIVGGPLLNIRGEVIGINTMMTGTPERMGFAIPSNLVKTILPALKGRIVRTTLGISVQSLTPALAQAFQLKEPAGALIAEVLPGGPADQGGLRRGDVIITFAGKQITTAEDLSRLVIDLPVGEAIPVTVIRHGKEVELTVRIEGLPEEGNRLKSAMNLGMTVQTITAELARDLGLPDASGVLITRVEAGGPAEKAGLRPEDVILEVNRKPIYRLSDYYQALKSGKNHEPILLLVRRGDRVFYTAVQQKE